MRTPALAASGAIALSLLLAGCSGGGGDASPADTGTDAGATAEASAGTERGDGALPVEYEV